MKCVTAAAIVLAACRQADQAPQAFDPKDPKSVVEHAARNTRALKSYRTRFKARLTPPKGDALHYDGTCVWAAPGILFIHYTASGGDEKNIVRAGEKVWVHHSLVGWVTSDEAGMPGAGRGVQNPDEVLAVLARYAGAAKLKEPGSVELPLSGEDIEKIMKEQAQAGAFLWNASSATVRLQTDPSVRLQKFACDAVLKPADPNVQGRVQYAAEFEATDYNGTDQLQFQDDMKKPIPLSKSILKAIESLKEKK
jgi:hypothetical protein